MIQKISKYAAHFVIFASLCTAFNILAPSVQAVDMWGEGDQTAGKQNIQGALGYEGADATDPRLVIARIVRTGLTFIGVIAVIIIIWGGFTWMTAGGNDDKVGDAKKIITAGVIGLLIILSAWALATWAIDTINDDIIKNDLGVPQA